MRPRDRFRAFLHRDDIQRRRKIRRAKQPARYYQKRREARRAEEIAFARSIGASSHHLEDKKGSNAWVETGVWPKQVA